MGSVYTGKLRDVMGPLRLSVPVVTLSEDHPKAAKRYPYLCMGTVYANIRRVRNM